ncbi:class I SAM-dependent methyltransferase [Melghirimyces algeriensis]|uniref:Phospholipid N-methyltransferase n=1 Tax=Melghirimyces algeriensis TaxID=910412 RepID=A0A521DKT8_9BACL|nr:methyltransferase domain-containing protein [Melghirimyces algeriensis]SMO72344.1 Phospholipid N-methyltransferase [Melghirimyces algeriensis]
MKKQLSEQKLFLSKFLQSPQNIGSVIPSSRFLVRAMLKPVAWEHVRSLVELGAGTGVLTRHFSQRIHPDCLVSVFEQDDELRKALQREFPQYHHYAQAESLRTVLQSQGVHSVDCILSSLPFAVFSARKRNHILKQVHQTLKKEGMFLTYQYSLQLKKELKQWFHVQKITFVPLNIPCAFVYLCKKT